MTADSTPTLGTAPNADSPRRTPLYIVCDDTPTYHIWGEPTEAFSTGRSLCGHVTAWPDGGCYRTGRQKPRVVDAPRNLRYLCAQCDGAYQEQVYQSQMERLAERLVEVARRLSTERLAFSARHAPRLLARHAARQVLRERAGQATVATHHAALRDAGHLVGQARALSMAVDALELVPASPHVAALIEPVITIGREALAGGAR